MVLSLPTADGDDQLVEVDLMLSAHANARAMYENKKLARAKELKTLEVRAVGHGAGAGAGAV